MVGRLLSICIYYLRKKYKNLKYQIWLCQLLITFESCIELNKHLQVLNIDVKKLKQVRIHKYQILLILNIVNYVSIPASFFNIDLAF